MRCPNCNKMVSYGDPELEVQSEEVDNDGNVNISVRMALTCAECGTELKEHEFELEAQVKHECKPKEKKEEEKEEGVEEGFDIEVDDPESNEDYRPKTDKKGKSVPMRYQKHFFGVQVTGHVTCKKCEEEVLFEISDDEQASGFDEL